MSLAKPTYMNANSPLHISGDIGLKLSEQVRKSISHSV